MADSSNAHTVLVVEDQALVRMYGVEILEDAGYHVLEAADADEALVILGTHDEIALLFSDIDFPGCSMDGLELARVVHQRWPAIRLLLTSGHHNLQDVALPDDGRFVRKPWRHEVLVEKVREVLA